MINEEHFEIIKQGANVWNVWRKNNRTTRPDLSNANLSYANLKDANFMDVKLSNANLSGADLIDANLINANLSGADFRGTNLIDANLRGANLSNANLSGADLIDARLSEANLSNADLRGANLRGADLSNARLDNAKLNRADLSNARLDNARLSEADLSYVDLSGAIFNNADLSGTRLNNAYIGNTILGNINLQGVKGLEAVMHLGPSTIGMDTLARSEGAIPVAFLKGAGTPDTLIEYARSLVARPIEYYTCFISYSSQDENFIRRLYADLQSNNVRCWFAPEDLKIGDKIRHRIDESIHLYDKLLVVLSQFSVKSQWVEHEVETAMDKELEGVSNVLFPVRLDNTILESKAGWASHIRLTRHIGDFERWKEHDEYQKSFQKLLRDLQAKDKPGSK